MRFHRKLFVLLLSAYCVVGCSKPTLEQALVGRWLENRDNRIVEFTQNGLYAVRVDGDHVEAGVWSVSDKELQMRGLTQHKQETWTVKMSGDSFTVDINDALFRKFDRVVKRQPIFDKRLEGVWRSDRGAHPEIVEFTPEGTVVGIFRRINQKKENFAIGCLGEVQRSGAGEFFLDGQMGHQKLSRKIQHHFTIDNEKLNWSRGRLRKPEVFRSIDRADVQALQGPPAAPTPASTATPYAERDKKNALIPQGVFLRRGEVSSSKAACSAVLESYLYTSLGLLCRPERQKVQPVLVLERRGR